MRVLTPYIFFYICAQMSAAAAGGGGGGAGSDDSQVLEAVFLHCLLNPEELEEESEEESEPKKKRGRPKGSKNKKPVGRPKKEQKKEPPKEQTAFFYHKRGSFVWCATKKGEYGKAKVVGYLSTHRVVDDYKVQWCEPYGEGTAICPPHWVKAYDGQDKV